MSIDIKTQTTGAGMAALLKQSQAAADATTQNLLATAAGATKDNASVASTLVSLGKSAASAASLTYDMSGSLTGSASDGDSGVASLLQGMVASTGNSSLPTTAGGWVDLIKNHPDEAKASLAQVSRQSVLDLLNAE
ncbi:hypothetical protein [Derxia gummosa]|uniref:Uncharacterized protein n=1 Tax=Derxia gummosa DSM 723 TaxID=1121388 RepID=A0A8B6X7B3_9BURK|nr:hypothetical protein [Derxia gummosa]